MKILQVVTDFSPKWGGVYQSVLGFSNFLKNDTELSIFSTFREEQSENQKIQGLKQFSFGASAKYQFSFEIKQALEKLIPQYDLIHIHGLWQFPLSYAAACARRFHVPYVYHIHGMLNKWPVRHHSFRKQIYAVLWEHENLNAADAIVCVTADEEKSVRDFQIKAPISVIPNGVYRSEIEARTTQKRFIEKNPHLAGKILLLFLRGIHPKKGINLLLRAFQNVTGQMPDAHLIIAGPEEDKNHAGQLKAFVSSRQLSKAVTFFGPVFGQSKKELLSSADLFVLSSHDEAFSIAVLEAMAHELPVLITRDCSFSDVASAQAGLVVDYDVNQLTDAMQRLVQNQKLRQKMGQNARELVESQYLWEVVAPKLKTLYEKIISNHQNPL